MLVGALLPAGEPGDYTFGLRNDPSCLKRISASGRPSERILKSNLSVRRKNYEIVGLSNVVNFAGSSIFTAVAIALPG